MEVQGVGAEVLERWRGRQQLRTARSRPLHLPRRPWVSDGFCGPVPGC
ncbi:hypothetical protein ACP70R_021089 [Stipagrostis hirtigluma subsp. patula]